MKLDSYLTTHTNINSKWRKYLNVRTKDIKIIDKNKLLFTAMDDVLACSDCHNTIPQ